MCRCVSNVCQCVVGCLRCDHEWTCVCGVACVFRSHPISRWGYRSIVTPWQRIRLLSASHHARSFFLSYFFFGQFGGYRVAPWPRDHGASAQTHRRGVGARLCDVPVLRVEVIPRSHACCLAHDVYILGVVPLRRRFCVTRPDAVLLTQARVFAIARRGSTSRSATAPATARSLAIFLRLNREAFARSTKDRIRGRDGNSHSHSISRRCHRSNDTPWQRAGLLSASHHPQYAATPASHLDSIVLVCGFF